MNVRQLIKELQSLPPDLEVKFAYDYGDHWHNTVCQSVEEIKEGYTTYSDYHQKDKLLEDEVENEEAEKCIIIS